MDRQKARMQWEKDQFVRLPRSADAIAGTEDSALIGSNCTLYAEVRLGIKEYHIKHAVPPPTSSASRTSDIMVQRNLAGQTFKPGCKTGESLKTVCSMHPDCGYFSHCRLHVSCHLQCTLERGSECVKEEA